MARFAAGFLCGHPEANQHATGLRAGEALHLAVAAAHGAHLVCLDKTLIDAAVAVGVYAVTL